MPEPTPEQFAALSRGYVVAPAGCGKTHLIVHAVAARPLQRHLVLTHTNAGVRALKLRLRLAGVAGRSFRVDTIAGWALRLAAAYPGLCGRPPPRPASDKWNEVYCGAEAFIGTSLGRSIVRASYDSVFVDEYQDCSVQQNGIITRLANLLPCRLVGDPLQAIFGFKNNVLVHWERDIPRDFERLDDLTTPHRWMGKNDALGEWLIDARKYFKPSGRLDLSDVPFDRYDNSARNRREVALGVAQAQSNESIIIVPGKWADASVEFSRAMNGAFKLVEPVESPDLHRWAETFTTRGEDLGQAAIDFVAACMNGVQEHIDAHHRVDGPPTCSEAACKDASAAVHALREKASPVTLRSALEGLARIGSPEVFREELWTDMLSAIQRAEVDEAVSIADGAWITRENARLGVRPLERRAVARTLLIKGLEFDHAVVIDPAELGYRDTYVSMTRGTRSLTVLTNEETLLLR